MTATLTLVGRTGIHLYDTLTWVGVDERCSTYRTDKGHLVYLAHGTARELVNLTDLDIHALWRQYPYADHEGFREFVAERLIEPDEADDELGFCGDCSEPDHEDELRSTSYDSRVCESCLNSYWFCNDCEEFFHSTTTTLTDEEVCETCRARNWSFCYDCDGFYPDDNASEHDHEPDMCCESPAQSFSIRNDGEPALWNDTRATVTLPAGIISTEGIGAISAHLRHHAAKVDEANRRQDDGDWIDYTEGDKIRQLSYNIPDALGDKWQTKEGNYTKRLSRYAYKNHAIKLPPEVISRVGCIASDHSTAIDFAIEITRDLNLSAEEFGHAESCFWQSYSESRCTLKSNGGFGLRTFSGYDVAGRAWVIPLRQTEDEDLTPTFDTMTPSAFIVFNGYGDLGGYAAARIMSHMAGMTYRKVDFDCSPIYINSDAAYLVAPEEIAEGYTDGHLSLRVNTHSNLYNTERALTDA